MSHLRQCSQEQANFSRHFFVAAHARENLPLVSHEGAVDARKV